ncbi:MAG TPA: hypothetical protein VGE42_07920 [Candidatus Dormibacteraeota bacterium]
MFAQVFDTVLELALLGLFAGVSGYAVHLVLTTVRGHPGHHLGERPGEGVGGAVTDPGESGPSRS